MKISAALLTIFVICIISGEVVSLPAPETDWLKEIVSLHILLITQISAMLFEIILYIPFPLFTLEQLGLD